MTSETVVLALHFQNDVLHPDGKIALGLARDEDRRRIMIAAAGRLLRAARRHAVPVVSVRIAFPADYRGVIRNCPLFERVVAAEAMQDGSWGADFYMDLGPEPGETVVTHSRVNAFYESSLAGQLERLGAKHLVLAGVATNSVVEHSARHAADMGYRVEVAADACGCAIPHLHEASLENMAFIATVRATDDILSGWDAQ